MAANDVNEIEAEIRRQMLAERAAAPAPPPQDDPPPYYAAPRRKAGAGGLAGAGAALLALFAKFKFLLVGLKLLTFGKLLLTGGSMLVSMWLWAKLYGWPFGVGVVLLIFAHECGHALAARQRGIPVGLMLFIPLMGAFVTTQRSGHGLADRAYVSLMGPVAGALAGVACVGGAFATGSPFWLALAQWSFLVNLLNLLPIPPLDGSRIAPLFLPAQRAQATAVDRWRFGLATGGLVLFLALGVWGLQVFLNTHRLPVA